MTILFTGQNIEGANALAIQSDGKIVAAGRAFVDFWGNFALARYNADGTLDETFGTGGKVLTSFGERSNDSAAAVAVQTDGKIVAAGGGGPCSPACQIELARYLGAIDTTPPSMTVPNTIYADGASPAGAPVTYSVTAVDGDDPNPTVACSPQSGSLFPLLVTSSPVLGGLHHEYWLEKKAA